MESPFSMILLILTLIIQLWDWKKNIVIRTTFLVIISWLYLIFWLILVDDSLPYTSNDCGRRPSPPAPAPWQTSSVQSVWTAWLLHRREVNFCQVDIIVQPRPRPGHPVLLVRTRLLHVLPAPQSPDDWPLPHLQDQVLSCLEAFSTGLLLVYCYSGLLVY